MSCIVDPVSHMEHETTCRLEVKVGGEEKKQGIARAPPKWGAALASSQNGHGAAEHVPNLTTLCYKCARLVVIVIMNDDS